MKAKKFLYGIRPYFFTWIKTTGLCGFTAAFLKTQ